MRRIAIAAAKGGTGKTTTAVTLGHALALAGRQVLLVDCDPRRHAAVHFGLSRDAGLAAWLTGDRARAVEVRAGLHVLDSGGAALADLDLDLARSPEGELRLRQALAAAVDLDYVLLDCGPGTDALARAVLRAADEVLVPVGADYLSLAAVEPLLEMLAALTSPAGEPRLLGLLPTFYDAAQKSAAEVEAVLAAHHPGRTLQTRVRTCDALRSAPARRGTVFDSEPLSDGAADYARLLEEIELLAA